MKQFRILLSIAIVGSLVVLSSCGKDDDPQLTKTQLLTSGSWKLTNVEVEGVGGSPPESYDADDTYTFTAAGAFTQDEGATKENPDDEQTVTGTWQLITNETFLRVTVDGGNFDREIVELTSTTLKVKFSFIFNFTETYTH